ncbi:MAG: type II CAAX prenyl endopeptidase Rce1 family protein [Gemmataceae bacterium]
MRRITDGTFWIRPRRAPVSPAGATALLVWVASVVIVAFSDLNTCYFGLAVAGYAVYLGAIGKWLLPKTVAVEEETVLRAVEHRPQRFAARCVVVVAAVALVALDGAAYAGIKTGYRVPFLTPMIQKLLTVRLWPGVGGLELLNFTTYALVPGLLLLALGARPRELGLCVPARGTVAATLLCLIPSLAFVGWGLATGKLTALGLFYLAVHNFLSNGFSEEFQCRGMIFSHLRACLRTDWALLVQAVIFALLHFRPNGVEERADPLGSLAEDLALNMPVALAFGFLALRAAAWHCRLYCICSTGSRK